MVDSECGPQGCILGLICLTIMQTKADNHVKRDQK